MTFFTKVKNFSKILPPLFLGTNLRFLFTSLVSIQELYHSL